MAVNLVLPTLSAWAASRLTGLFESKSQSDFDTTFEATFATDCKVVVNGKSLSLEEYKAELLGQSAAAFDERSAVVSIQGQTEVETGNQGQLCGLVGLFYTTLADSKFLVLGAPTERQMTSSINLVQVIFTIEPTQKNPQNPNLHVRGYFDPRRVTAVNQVVAESTYHVSIPAASVPKGTGTSSAKKELGPGPLTLPPNYTPRQGAFGGVFGPGPVRLPQQGPFGGHFGPGPVKIPPLETAKGPESLPGDGEFGAPPVLIPGETIGKE